MLLRTHFVAFLILSPVFLKASETPLKEEASLSLGDLISTVRDAGMKDNETNPLQILFKVSIKPPITTTYPR